MPALDNAKRERFCREYVIDGNATQAYIRAGYSETGAQPSAARLLSNAMVAARIAELQAKVAAKLEITHESVLEEIEDTRKKAADAEQYSTALKASELKGRHIGMWPQKIEHKHDLQFLDGMTLDELRAARDLLRPVAGGSEPASGGNRTTH